MKLVPSTTITPRTIAAGTAPSDDTSSNLVRHSLRLHIFSALLLVFLTGLAIAQSGSQPSLRIFSPHEIPFDCSNYSPETMGLKALEFSAYRTALPDAYGLKLTYFRVAPEVPLAVTIAGGEYDLAYRDVVFAHHVSESELQRIMNKAIDRAGAHDKERLIDWKSCPSGDAANAVRLYSPLVAVTEDGVPSFLLSYSMFTADIYFRRDRERDAEIIVESLDDPVPDENSPDSDNVQSDFSGSVYPWVANFQLKEMAEAEPVLVVEKSECREGRNFFVVSTGHLVGDVESVSAPEWTVVRSKMYAVNHHLGVSGDSAMRHVVENSVDPTHYWCVPKREFCYKSVDFGAFNVSARKGRAETMPASKTYNLRLGIVSALQLMVTEHCPNTASNGEER